MDVSIRLATPPDAALILSFLHKKAAFDRGNGGFTGQLQTSEERLRKTLFNERPFAQVLLAELDRRPCGFALFYFRYSSFAGRPSLWLDDLYVDEDARSRGVGAALMTKLVQLAGEQVSTHLGWTASVNNPRGLAFYERLGATVVAHSGLQQTLRLELPALLSTGR